MKFILTFFSMVFFLSGYTQQDQSIKPRTIVTTDGEIDDVDSYIRMLLYANEYRIEGLIYSSSMWHYKGDGKGTKFISEMDMTKKMYGEKTTLRWPGVTWMNELLDAYEKVYPKLSTHAKGYPTASYLKSIVKVGNIDFEGEMNIETEGSDFIKAKLLDNSVDPIYLQVWGGTNTIARSLKSIEDQYKNTSAWPDIYKKVCNKAIIYAILDQDATYRKYISVNWKDIKVYYNSHQFWCFAYTWKQAIPSAWHKYFEGEFMSKNIILDHGPLTALYYSYGDGKKQEGDDEHYHGDPAKIKKTMWGDFNKYDFISEGDSPAFLHLIDVGLDNLEHPEYGGWGGRLMKSAENPLRWEDGDAVAELNPFSQKTDQSFPQTRWVEAIQQDFAARADWCIREFKDANHPPEVLVEKKHLIVKPGQKYTINVKTSDPDNHKVALSFWQYVEAGNSGEKLKIFTTGNEAKVEIPLSVKTGDTFHIIAEGRDNGLPSLTRYQRVVLIVQ
jgi:Protein of unknown function (DUF1593)